MPIIHVNVREGFGKEKAEVVIQKITKVFVDLSIPRQAMGVIVHEVPRSRWGIGGEPASERLEENPSKWIVRPQLPSRWALAFLGICKSVQFAIYKICACQGSI